MTDSRDHREKLKPIARESLETFKKIADSAQSEIDASTPGGGTEALASGHNTWTSPKPIEELSEVRRNSVEVNKKLTREPAIARVVVIDGNKEKTTYYICRVAPPTGIGNTGINLASYRSPVGRIASLDIGEETSLPREGQTESFEILEKTEFNSPILKNNKWDSRPENIFKGKTYSPPPIESLRALLDDEIDTALLDSLIDGGRTADGIWQGTRRAVITKMDLRDQPILDRYQDEIFRLPLNSRLLILGAPGTGKTTTLIKRLGQKLDPKFLDADEKQMVNRLGNEIDHSQSWIMFTPTELLKLYVKEAFNREGIPASNVRIRTWTHFRLGLARNVFHILRSESGKNSYVMKEPAKTLEKEAVRDPIDWFTDFDEWQKLEFLKGLRASAESLSENSAPEVAQIGRKLLSALEAAGTSVRPGLFVSLMARVSEIRGIVDNLKQSSDGRIRNALNRQVNKDHGFLDELATFINGLSDLSDDREDSDADAEEEEDGENNRSQTGRIGAETGFERAVRAQARARARGRNVSKSSRNGRLIEWLNDRTLTDQELKETGKILLVQSALRRFINPVRRYIDGVPARYRRFRRDRRKENRWYRAEGFNRADIHPLEVDIILLAMIRGTDELIRDSRIFGGEDTPARATLERLQNLHITQVLVDEATDFSPIQLSCMATLARPGTRSFFACGDFNQRVTNWGTRSDEQMKWVVPDIRTETVSRAYRQSRRLHDLAERIVGLSGGGAANAVPSDYAENEGVRPVLAVRMTEESEIAKWLASRVQEIERRIGALPSIAVLVNSEEEVQPVAAKLEEALADENIQVTACLNGQVLGEDSAVRVFNVEHIKGLEFEAVFFVGLDKLAETQPDLFDKYLYVGATRAATYLGITCEKEFPPEIDGLRELFGEKWE